MINICNNPPNTAQEHWESFNSTTLNAIALSTGLSVEDIPQEALDLISEIYTSSKYPDIYAAANKVVKYIKTLQY